MNALIVGAIGVGKSTLIRRVLTELNCSVSGYETRKEDALADERRGSPVYIYDVGQERVRTAENLLGYRKDRQTETFSDAFDRYARKLQNLDAKGVILMDEIGFMEASSETFCAAVLKLLDGNVPVLAAVKDRDTPFLNRIRSHPNCRCFFITEDNRDRLCAQVVSFLRQQLSE